MTQEANRTRKSTFSLEIDKLMKKLPKADPYLRGEQGTDVLAPPTHATVVRPKYDTPETQVPAMRVQGAQIDRALTWLIVLAAVVVGAALTQWPYAHACGWRLGFYLGAVAVQLVTSGWGALVAWRVQSPAAHVVALVALFWGIVLAAEQILPRVGYAASEAVWRCTG